MGARPALLLLFGAVLSAAVVLAALGYLSLRRWEVAAELQLREQARDTAAMAAEKVEMAVVRAEQDAIASLQAIAAAPDFGPPAIEAWRARNPLFGAVYLCDRHGRVLYPVQWSRDDAEVIRALRGEISERLWDRGGRRRLEARGQVILAAVIPGSSRGPLLVGLRRDDQALYREVLEKTLGGTEGKGALAVLDGSGRAVFTSEPLDPTAPVLTVPFGEALPDWRVALYQPAGLSPRDMVRRQSMIFMAAFALLLLMIAAGLVATYRLMGRESEIARLKSDFVANVSHDLKTPLALIRMFAETLEMDRVPDERRRREYYAVLTRESERLSRLIDNVLDFSRIESGRQRYEIVSGPVEPILHDVVESFRHPIEQQGFAVETAIEPDLPDVPLDGEALKQALANLVDNAMKYSGDRRRIRVAARRDGGGVAVEVADEGIGIPVSERERIFEKFYRIGRSETQGRRGSGVGLALVKHIVEAHGGRVTVDGRPGEGSRFTLHLPPQRTGQGERAQGGGVIAR
ncbi:MAG TPA: HAMP domain-containing sensor histidine kinase [Candidatus Limnocylindria bacterium]|nr:HAMP domain-containing sensor histidine kinase [Candidatus Limnocylindria bacterium]